MISLASIQSAAKSQGLAVRGALHPAPADCVPETAQTVILLGPDEPAFWPVFSSSEEAKDGQPDPMDRWSKRICNHLAEGWSGTAIFPSDGPPYPPFLSWAVQSQQAWASPVGLLVHGQAGLFISYRAAVALPLRLDLPQPPAKPCNDCAAPCKAACPVGAIVPGQPYDIATCKAYLRSPEGEDCSLKGCLVRRACPISTDFLRLEEQSAFHMAAFLKN